ncbi:MAG TPA: excinuclease ABC subunit B [Myxococcales bacterium]|nr:excinuclease ABC subunit B [Myxococcales bacterium]HAN30529.1 excinuclease ABC subunit B [Myxococcales bacterium]
MSGFKLIAPFEPSGDQPTAIEQLVQGLRAGDESQVLLGVTGSGKTFSIANVINEVQRPTLVLAPNKILAAQLHAEFKSFFPNNAVEYFVSYYDYYQPEAYIASTDTFIEKDALINEEIDRMRHAATFALLERRDVIIVASVSCIYGIGAPANYLDMRVKLSVGQQITRRDLLRALVDIQYDRSDLELSRGHFRARGDVIEVQPAASSEHGYRICMWGDEIESIERIDALRGKVLATVDTVHIYPNSHYVTPPETVSRARQAIADELTDRLIDLRQRDKLVEAQRLEQRTQFDLEELLTRGFCKGIENYSRYLTGREPGQPPPTLLDYFPDDFLMVVDESHVSVSQVRAMYRGDRSRKMNLVDFGFRLPSAVDNRPLMFDEFLQRIHQTIYVSATPGDWELEQTEGVIVEQVVRPTGLVDPSIEIRPVGQQVDDLLEEIRLRSERDERVLVTTLTKRMAENLSDYYADLGVKVRYMHSDIDTLERIELLRGLRAGEFDVLVGINLLREGLDLPEVSLVAILDADKEGFLRSRRSMIQTIGRAARNAQGRVIMYADRVTGSMKAAIEETDRRRSIQELFNEEHGLTPQTIRKAIYGVEALQKSEDASDGPSFSATMDLVELKQLTVDKRAEMRAAARDLEFERAAALRDEVRDLEGLLVALG